MTIDQIKEKVIPIAKEYGVTKIALFGSVAKGTATENSDVDFLIDKGDSHKMRGWDFFDFENEVSEALGVKAEVFTYRGIQDSIIKDSILENEVVIYEYKI